MIIICPREWDAQTDHQISARRPDLIMINKKERTCKIEDFVVLADRRVKLKECKKKDDYLGLTSELKKLWNMKVTIIPIVISALATVTKWLVQQLEDLETVGLVETIQTTVLLRSTRIEDTWQLEETCCHSSSTGKPLA